MASPSSSDRGNVADTVSSVVKHPGERRKVEESVEVYDVFINHRGPDVKKTVARQLYNSLKELGIHAYLDSEERQYGTSIPSAIKTAIGSARVHIPIFSKGYADSPLCLAELVLMRKTGVKIIPVFYEVEPSEVRYIKKREYQRAFEQYEKKKRYSTDELNEWKEALRQISLVGGHEIKKSRCPFGFRRTPDCTEIVRAVQREMGKMFIKLNVPKHSVGFSMLVEKFEKEYHINGGGQGKARIAGICGMGGIGKTTLSKELYNRNREKYTRASFLSGVREASIRGNLVFLQQRLLEDLFNEGGRSFSGVDEGISYLKDRLARIPVVNFLIVLDDIDHKKQLQNLLVDDMKNKSGDSLIIISTRDAGVLAEAEIPTFLKFEGLGEHEATELFCLHAFGQRTPRTGYEGLVDGFVQGCRGLQLSLKVLGAHLYGRTEDYWELELEKVPKIQPKDIKEILKISFDGLNKEEKQIFIDIACFSFRKDIVDLKSKVISIWNASGWNAEDAVQTLQGKCLVEVTGSYPYQHFQMHDLLRDLGRRMADDMGPPRLWQPHILRSMEAKGFKQILAETKTRCFHSFEDSFLKTNITYFIGNFSGETQLLWLDIDNEGGNLRNIPSWVPLRKLHVLTVGKIEEFWTSFQQLLQINAQVDWRKKLILHSK